MQALMIIDMQKWMFRYPERLAQVGKLTSNIATLVSLFEEKHYPVFEIVTVLKADKSNWSRLMLKYDYPCLLEGTEDILPVEGYVSPAEAIKIRKTRNSAFLGTQLETKLKDLGIQRLYLTGVFIDGCVGLTAAEAAQLGYEVTFIKDAIGTAESDLNEPIFKWLINDYELDAVESIDVLNHLR